METAAKWLKVMAIIVTVLAIDVGLSLMIFSPWLRLPALLIVGVIGGALIGKIITGGRHGLNRRTNAQVHGNPNLAHPGVAGVFSLRNVTWISSNPGTFLSARIASDEPVRPIESAGIVLGELVGYRAWTIYGGELRSVVQPHVWPCGEASATSEDALDDARQGFHAFKSLADAVDYVSSHVDAMFCIGEVTLWGNIVEHEIGYRAQFAYPRRLFSILWGPFGEGHAGLPRISERQYLAEISERYGLAA